MSEYQTIGEMLSISFHRIVLSADYKIVFGLWVQWVAINATVVLILLFGCLKQEDFTCYIQRIEITFVRIAVNLIGSTAIRDTFFDRFFIFQGIADDDRHIERLCTVPKHPVPESSQTVCTRISHAVTLLHLDSKIDSYHR